MGGAMDVATGGSTSLDGSSTGGHGGHGVSVGLVSSVSSVSWSARRREHRRESGGGGGARRMSAPAARVMRICISVRDAAAVGRQQQQPVAHSSLCYGEGAAHLDALEYRAAVRRAAARRGPRRRKDRKDVAPPSSLASRAARLARGSNPGRAVGDVAAAAAAVRSSGRIAVPRRGARVGAHGRVSTCAASSRQAFGARVAHRRAARSLPRSHTTTLPPERARARGSPALARGSPRR